MLSASEIVSLFNTVNHTYLRREVASVCETVAGIARRGSNPVRDSRPGERSYVIRLGTQFSPACLTRLARRFPALFRRHLRKPAHLRLFPLRSPELAKNAANLFLVQRRLTVGTKDMVMA